MYIYAGKSKKKKKIRFTIIFAIIFVVGAFKIIQIYNGIEINNENLTNNFANNNNTGAGKNIAEIERLSTTIGAGNEKNTEDVIASMIEDNMNNVVGISKLKNNGDTVFLQDGVTKMGIGSGVIVSEKGFILTNEHVSGEKSSNCYVTMEDGKSYTANVVWSDSDLDLSIIKINMKCLNYANLGDSDSIKVGQGVYAIGNPIGFEFQKTVTSGIVSALNRTITFKENNVDIYMSNLIQTDATINPGNSGGPLINSNGEVVGINTVKITSAEGIGFAVPVNVVKPILQKLEQYGKFEEASIGIFAYDKNIIPYLNSNLSFETGIYVAQVSLDSPAYRRGLQIGDIITQIDDIAVNKMCDLRQYIYTKNIGDNVNLTVLRNNRKMNIDIELGRK